MTPEQNTKGLEETPRTGIARYKMSAYKHRDGRLLVDAIRNESGGWVMHKDYEALAIVALQLATKLGVLQKQLEEHFHDD